MGGSGPVRKGDGGGTDGLLIASLSRLSYPDAIAGGGVAPALTLPRKEERIFLAELGKRVAR